jgi:HEAT repeat protein
MSWLLPPLPPKFEAALRDVRAKRPESRVAAAERLGRADPEQRAEALAGLRSLARDEHPSVRATALAALGTMIERGMLATEPDVDARGPATEPDVDIETLDLVLGAFSDAAPEVRELAALAAARIGGTRALAALREALRSPAPEVRFQAADAIAELAPERAARDLAPLLSDPDPEVRGQAICGLAGLADPGLSKHFAAALADASAAVRLEAALALAGRGDKRGEPELLRALAAGERVIEVARALSELPSTRAVEPLARVARSFFTSPHVRAAVGAALVLMGDLRGAEALRRVLTGLRAEARSYAVDLVRETQARDLVPELARLAVRPRGADLLSVVDALAAFAGSAEPARAALSELAERPDEVGARARAALGG